LDAYRDPIMSIQAERISPPDIADVRRPHLSARRKAGTDMASMRMAESPEAKNEACSPGIPAWENKTGAYFESVKEA
jgi:hypothetical protein